MSTRFLKSVQSIQPQSEYDVQLKSDLDIVNSYLNIDEWVRDQQLTSFLSQKLQAAKKLKDKVMKFYNLSSYSQVVGFRCQVCKQVFDQPTALGGHMSKAHPDFKKQQALQKQQRQRERQSSIEKIKKQQDQIHLQSTGIHRQYSTGISY